MFISIFLQKVFLQNNVIRLYSYLLYLLYLAKSIIFIVFVDPMSKICIFKSIF